jgi:sterol desaturase/sphingolipid hydroxylase (fatty acid hydroxylase superfamily)
MTSPEPAIRTDVMPPSLVFWGLQPAVLALIYCSAVGMIPGLGTFSGLLLVLLIFTIAEEIWPARRDWKQTLRERLGCLGMFAASLVAMAIWQEWLYPAILGPSFAPLREILAPLWPRALPLVLQTFIAFLFLSFVAYWLHRFQHRIGVLWRGTGHGVHHTYKSLNAINWNANHPFEAISLVLPAALLDAMFDTGSAAEAAAAVAIICTACAHMNIRVNIKGIGLIFTSNVHHVHHHSHDYRESNTNYGCASTLWDRVFGTFEHADTAELGDFATEPSLARKLALPITGR